MGEGGFNLFPGLGRQVFLPAETALLFACHGEHQGRRLDSGEAVGGVRKFHGVEAAHAEAHALGHRPPEYQFPLLHLDFAGKVHLRAGGIEQSPGDTDRIVLVQAHFLLDLVLDFYPFRNLEGDSLFLELGEGLQTLRARRKRQKFRTGLFGLQLDLRQVFPGHAHVFEEAGPLRHQGVHLLLAFVILLVEKFPLLVGGLTVFPAGGNGHVPLFAGFFQVGLGAVQFRTLLDGVDICRSLLCKRGGGSQGKSDN